MITPLSIPGNIRTMRGMGDGLGTYIRTRRESLGMTQTDLAAAVEVKRPHLSRIESGGIGLPEAGLRRRLAAVLGVRHIDLLVAAGELSPDELPREGAPPPGPPAGSDRAALAATIAAMSEEEAHEFRRIVEPQVAIVREAVASRRARRAGSARGR